jgi:hypothetical protein
MNAIGFSKCERKIHIDDVDLNNELLNIFRLTDRVTGKLVGSTSEGMCGGIYGNQSHHDYDSLCTVRDIKLYTLLTNNINNPPLLENPMAFIIFTRRIERSPSDVSSSKNTFSRTFCSTVIAY